MKRLSTQNITFLTVLLIIVSLQVMGSKTLADDLEYYEVSSINSELPDITSSDSIRIADTVGEWGSSIQLRAEDAIHSVNGRCVFPYQIQISNRGESSSDSFEYRINVGSWSRVESYSGLDTDEVINTHNTIALETGKQKVVIKLDSNQEVVESNELNNVPFALRVKVKGDCDSNDNRKSLLANKNK